MGCFRVFKATYNDRKGRARESAKWYVEFRDHNEAVRRLPAFTSKAASEEMGRNLVKLVDYHKGTGGQTDPALARWLAELPQRTRAKLVEISLLNPERAAVSKPLSEHLGDFGKALQAKGGTERHVDLVTSRARRVVEGCGFRFYSDMNAGKVMAFLADLRADTKDRRGISAQTFNFYLGAVKQFCRWMVKDRRAAESPVAHLDGLNVRTDRRHDRRAFTVDELMRLLAAARGGPERCGLSGEERSILYWLAVETGLRAGELRSLTRASFNLDGDAPTVVVGAAYSKRRREDTLPLRADLAKALRAFLATKTPQAPVFRMPDRRHHIDLFRADLAAAEIVYRDDAGRVADFHALRHTFISNLAAGGIHPKMAQGLARHSTITLTMDRYTHTVVGEQSAALAARPDLTRPARPAMKATGTDDAPNGPPVLADCLASQGRFSETPVDADGRPAGGSDKRESTQKPLENSGKTADFQGKQSGEGGIRTLGRLSSSPVFETGPIGRSGTSPIKPISVYSQEVTSIPETGVYLAFLSPYYPVYYRRRKGAPGGCDPPEATPPYP